MKLERFNEIKSIFKKIEPENILDYFAVVLVVPAIIWICIIALAHDWLHYLFIGRKQRSF